MNFTEEDKKAQEAGNFDLAYGSDEIEITTSCMVEWDMDGQGTACSSLARAERGGDVRDGGGDHRCTVKRYIYK